MNIIKTLFKRKPYTPRHILYHCAEARTIADVCCEILDGEEICARCRHRNMDDEHVCGSLSDCAEALAIMLEEVE